MQGTRLGPYALLAEPDSGGMGTPWHAAARDGAAVARKLVPPHLVADAGEALRSSRDPARAPPVAEAPAADGARTHTTRVRRSLWQATGDRSHSAQAERLLDESLANAPVNHHAATQSNACPDREFPGACSPGGSA